MHKRFKKLLKNIINASGYQIYKLGTVRLTLREALNHFSRLGLAPQTVIDAGAADGTFELYEEFPDALHILIEPLEEFKDRLEAISNKYKTEVIIAAASDKPGETIINVHDVLTGSSLLKEEEGCQVDGFPRQIMAVTIDDICNEKGLSGPYVIKVDVQGAELIVLNGARKVMTQTELIILEVNLFHFFKDGPELYHVVNYMKNHGFCVYDIVGQAYRPLDGALSSVDLLFVQEDGKLRTSHHWASPEQRHTITKNLLSKE